MSHQRYTEELKIEVIKQVMERGHPITKVAARLGVSGYRLHQWMKR
ncbi:transposase [Halomonas sp. WWR20]